MLQLINAISPLAICAMKCFTVCYVTAQLCKMPHISAREAKEIFKMVRKLLKK